MPQEMDKEKLKFVTSGMLSFPALFPGQAENSQREGSKAYKLELITADPGQSLINALCYAAAFNDSSAINPATGQPMWHRHIFGPAGRLKKLEEYPRRDPAKYPYAIGKFVISLSKVVSLKTLKMEGANLSDPATRARYDQMVAAKAPKVSKWLNPHDPADMQWVAEENARRQFSNTAPLVTEDDIRRTSRPLRPDEIWAGCQVQVSGRVYWDKDIHKTGLLALEQVMLVSHGDRLVAGEAAPEDVFGAFAPAADLAPPMPPQLTGLPQPAPVYPAVPNPYGQPSLPLPGHSVAPLPGPMGLVYPTVMPPPPVQLQPAPQRNPFDDFR